MAMDKYWMVHNVSNGCAPNKRHASLDAARTEAIRLAQNQHGHTFTVLEVVECYGTMPRPVEQIPVKHPDF